METMPTLLIVELAFAHPATPERLAARPAHRERLTRLHAEGRLLAAGPYADDSGALLVFEVAGGRPELERIVAEDPYYRTPGVEVAAVREWTLLVRPAVRPSSPGTGDRS